MLGFSFEADHWGAFCRWATSREKTWGRLTEFLSFPLGRLPSRHREGINDRGEKIWGRLKNSYLSPEMQPIAEFKHQLNFRREKDWGRPINLSFRCEGTL